VIFLKNGIIGLRVGNKNKSLQPILNGILFLDELPEFKLSALEVI